MRLDVTNVTLQRIEINEKEIEVGRRRVIVKWRRGEKREAKVLIHTRIKQRGTWSRSDTKEWLQN